MFGFTCKIRQGSVLRLMLDYFNSQNAIPYKNLAKALEQRLTNF